MGVGQAIVKAHGTGRDRWESKRRQGISDKRPDGSLTSPETDIQAFAAEREAAKLLGCKFDDTVYAGGDRGHDFEFVLTIDVKWLGIDRKTNMPRGEGHLIVNPDEPQRLADIFVVMAGSEETGFQCLGWTTRSKLLKSPLKSFNYGEKFNMPTSDLSPIERLLALKPHKAGQ